MEKTMLIEFTVANYRSFRDPVTLSMEPVARLRARDEEVNTANVAATAHGDVLRVAAVYGANASGKSNLIRAMGVLRDMVVNSAREGQAGDAVPVEPFRLDPTSVTEPTELEVVFLLGTKQVRYGVAATREKITREWLHVAEAGGEEQLGFEREGEGWRYGSAWEADPSLEKKTRTGALHLSVAAAFNHGFARELLPWFVRWRPRRAADDAKAMELTKRLLRNVVQRPILLALVQTMDPSIEDLVVEAEVLPAELSDAMDAMEPDVGGVARQVLQLMARRFAPIRTIHRANPDAPPVQFRLEDESEGTQRVIALAGDLLGALASGATVVIDEFDARLHTLLSLEIVRLFQSPETNPRNAQLIFATHDTNLLSRALFRRDQLWFVEKNRSTHATDLYSLAEIKLDDGKKVRNDASYEHDYLQGRYGAIPFFGNLQAILGSHLSGKGDDEEG